MRKNTVVRILFALIGLFLLGMCTLCNYFTLFRYVDASICYSRAGRKIGVSEADQNTVYQFVKGMLHPGMSKDEVMSRLSDIGPSVVTGTTELYDGTIRETVKLDICLHPLNDILLLLRYSKDLHSKDLLLEGYLVIED